MRTAGRVVAVMTFVALVLPRGADAADKAHQQLMAEIRMLQEQQQQLQQILGSLADTLKVVTSKLDDQTGANRKAFADQKLLIDNVAEGVRILREKSDDTNVRLSSMTQEIESMRQTLASMPGAGATPAGEPPAAGETNPPATPPTGVAPFPNAPANPPANTANVSASKMYDASFADYIAGQWDLAVLGFETYIRMFPRTDKTDDAQLNIGNSLYGAGKNREAVAAYQKVISDYPTSDSVPVAYYKLGLTYEALKQTDLAKKSYETVIQKYPTASEAILARQRLDNLNRRD
jgi:tol-pal system protein YbgF